ncbi:hypothetical protein [Paenibacillus sinopodophylli]|uniref:hypothetical protein n=1 Tax=Paenibacillus sinopodophylli TaxID=1837342 RepID=UPI00110D1366|nr:hypothetical protein [Paenibacillus sinopodophylli]
MAEPPSEQSTQKSIMMQFASTQQAGTMVHLQDETSKTIASFAPTKDYQTVVISSPELREGTTYTLYTGGSSTGSESGGLYSEGEYQAGSEIVSATLSTSITYLSESGVTSGRTSGQGGGGRGRL